MKCHNCGTETEELCLVPTELEEEWSCVPCAKTQGLLCEKHDNVHTKFITADPEKTDGGHACLLCIEQMVTDNISKSQDYCDRICAVLPENELRNLTEWADTARNITGDEDHARPILRALATYSARCNKSLEEVVVDIERSPSVKHILPTHYFI